MPRLIDTPEELMVRLSSNVFYLQFADWFDRYLDGKQPSGLAELMKWFEEELPGKTWEPIGPSAFSGDSGGVCGKYAVFPMSTNDVEKFSARWEIHGNGKSIDSRWQAYILLFDPNMLDRLKEHYKNNGCI